MKICDVSVVIPAYNSASFIIEALKSVIQQTCSPRELIVVNDGSNDNTEKLILEWISFTETPIPVILINQLNSGVPVARNNGLRSAQGEWVAFLDSDDIWEPEHLEELLKISALKSGVVAVYGAGRLLQDGKLQDLPYDKFWDNPSEKFGDPIKGSPYLEVGRNIFPRLLIGNFIKPSSLMILRQAAFKAGIFDESLRTGEDREFLIRLLFFGSFIYSPKLITRYRWHDENLSQKKNAKRNLLNSLMVLKKVMLNYSLGLSTAEKRSCRDQVHNECRNYLYVCANDGIASYADGMTKVRSTFGAQKMIAAFNLRHLVRALLLSKF